MSICIVSRPYDKVVVQNFGFLLSQDDDDHTILSRFLLSKGVVLICFDCDLLCFGLPPRFIVKTADNWVGICSKGSELPSLPVPRDSWCIDSSRSIAVTSDPIEPPASFNTPSREIRLWKMKRKIQFQFSCPLQISISSTLFKCTTRVKCKSGVYFSNYYSRYLLSFYAFQLHMLIQSWYICICRVLLVQVLLLVMFSCSIYYYGK